MTLCDGTDYDTKITIAMKDSQAIQHLLVVTHSDINLTVHAVRRQRLLRMHRPIRLIDFDGIVGRPIAVEFDALYCAKDLANQFRSDLAAIKGRGHNEIDISVILFSRFFRRDLDDREDSQE